MATNCLGAPVPIAENHVVLLDGGMGQELVKRSARPPTPLWSTTVLLEEPKLVADLHADYIDAQARVITLNNYTATPWRLAQHGLSHELPALHAAAIAAAQQGRKQAKSEHPVVVAGCLPPLVSSYQAEDVPSADQCALDYRLLVEVQQAGVDLFLCETLSTVLEVQEATRAAVATGKPVWVGMTVDDQDGTRLRGGESLAQGAQAAADAGAQALLINCAWPEAVSQGLVVLAQFGLPFGGYANGFSHAAALKKGQTVAHLSVREDLTPEAYTAHVLHWLSLGARIVGGCCEVGPAHIEHLGQALLQGGYTLSCQPMPA